MYYISEKRQWFWDLKVELTNKVTFAQVDHQLFTLLWQWAQRRHPKKSRWWIKDKYFRSENGNNWVFFGQI
jgi:RNA-directed DNA polymerase